MLIDNVSVFPIDKNCISYYGYLLYRNGTVTDAKNKPLNKYNLHYPNSHVSMKINGKLCRKNIARLLYGLFHELDTGEYTSNKNTLLFFKDGNSGNIAYDNLEVITRKEGYERLSITIRQDEKTGNFLPRFTKEEVREIRKKYLGKEDGRTNKNQYSKTTPSIRELAKEYQCSTSIISKIIKGEYK